MQATSNPNNPNALKLIIASEIGEKELAIDFKSEPKREPPNLTSPDCFLLFSNTCWRKANFECNFEV